MAELVRVTRPGGWIELAACGFGFKRAGPATIRFVERWEQVSKLRGIDTSAVASIDRWLIEAETKSVEKHSLYVPIGQWGKYRGERDTACVYVTL